MEIELDFKELLSRKHLIANKKAIGRKKDLADLEALGE